MLSKKEKFMEYLSNFPERLRELMFDRGEMKSEELGAAIGVHGTNVRACKFLPVQSRLSLGAKGAGRRGLAAAASALL